MKEFDSSPQKQSRTLEHKPKVGKQASITELLDRRVKPLDATERHHLLVEQKISAVDKEIQNAIKQCKDTEQLEIWLEAIKHKYELKFIELLDLGTPDARIKYQVNPIMEYKLPSNELLYVMTGTKACTKVEFHTENLTINNKSALVGKKMIANPLANDHEPGSTSTNDSVQNGIMSELMNAGNTGVPNDQKYIKGHLLNDNVGGQGACYNLFPITADANAKHLVYVEKYIKSQIKAGYVVYYEIWVEHDSPKPCSGKHYINADYNFRWASLDATGKQLGGHTGKIESRYNALGSAPFDVTMEYASLFDKLNLGKSTPQAVPQSGQWYLSGSSPAMARMGFTSTSMPYTSFLPSFFGAKSPMDLSALSVKNDAGVNYLSVRNNIAAGLSVGTVIKTNIGDQSIISISFMAGGWTRLYF